MNVSTRNRPALWMLPIAMLCSVAALALLPARSGSAEEPARQFLEALRANGLFDLAREYLEQMEKSELAPADFRETILYEQGLTLMAVSRTETDFTSRQQRLDEAQKKFREFLTAQKNHDFAPMAKSELANVLVERARVKMAEADRARNAADKPKLLQEAGEFYEKAYEEFKESQSEIAKKIESLPRSLDPQRDAQRIEYRDQLRADYVKVLMVQATILHEKAKTAASDKEKNETLKRAADAYGDIYEKYRRRLAGLYALLQKGACYQEMGGEKNVNEAISYYQELLDQPHEEQPLRVLRTKTLIQTLQCWIDDSIKEKKLDPAIETASAWIRQMRPNEYRDGDWLNLHLETGRAYKLKIAEFNENDPKRAVALRAARSLVDHGAKHSTGELNEKFLALKAELGGKIEKPAEQRPDPQTFAEAYKAGRDAWEVIKQHSTTKSILEDKIKRSKDNDERAAMQQQLAELEKEMVNTRFDAIEFFRTAIRLTTPQADLDEVNNVRFYLCSLHFTEKNYYDAAGYGEYIARFFPGHLAAKYCATIARASYLNLFNQSPEDDRDFQADLVVGICKLTLEKWPDDADAEDALITLVKFMVRQKDLPGAKKYLAMVKPDSARRGEAEIATGQAMWSAYLQGLQQVRQWESDINEWKADVKKWNAGEEQPPEGIDAAARNGQIAARQSEVSTLRTELAPLKVEAQETLKNGIQRMRAKGIDATLATAVLSLCQIYVDGEQAQDAIALLEDKEIGALTLVKGKHEAVSREGVAQETYKTALRAYIGALPGASNKAELIAKAEGAMDGLKGTVSQDAAGQERLISIYVTLAGEVKKQIDLASPANKLPLTQGFATFLDKVAATSNEFTVLNWVAENFYTLGQVNDPGKGELPADVKAFYDKAAGQYQKLVEKGASDQGVTNNMLVQLRLRMANVLRRQGRYVQAMDQFEEVLKDPKRNSMLNVQVDAAATYMEWARSGVGIPKLYRVAVSGGRPTRGGQKNIWGWHRIAQRLSDQLDRQGAAMDQEAIQKFTDVMHQARHQKAECYYQYALLQDDESRRNEFLEVARQDIRLTSRSFPDLGGPQWQRQYDQLLRNIQTAMKQEAVGLEAFADAPEEVAAATPRPGGGGE